MNRRAARWLVVALAAACLSCGGCARMLGAIIAPQQSMAATADQASTGVQQDLVGMSNEVNRLIAGAPNGNEELQRLKSSLERNRHAMDQPRQGSAQHDLEPSCRPWPRRDRPGDRLVLVQRPPDVPGKPVRIAPLPDGVPGASVTPVQSLMLIGPSANRMMLSGEQ